MTLEEFFAAFAVEARQHRWHLEPVLYGDRGTVRVSAHPLRTTLADGSLACPISVLHYRDCVLACDVATHIGMGTETRYSVMAAADEMPLHERWIRARLLEACGLTEEGR